MRKLLLLSLPVVLAGCQTWGPTWSEVTGVRYTTPDGHGDVEVADHHFVPGLVAPGDGLRGVGV